jgi:hypothetical protein
MSGRYRVAWKCLVTNLIGHGSYTDYASAKEWADYGNRKWGSDPWARRQEWRQVLGEEDDGLIIQHWVESYPIVKLASPPTA